MAVKPKRRPKIKASQIRTALGKMREQQIRPDINGDIHFMCVEGRYWVPYDERDSWLLGKPLGAS